MQFLGESPLASFRRIQLASEIMQAYFENQHENHFRKTRFGAPSRPFD
jgi:hypothetical protein